MLFEGSTINTHSTIYALDYSCIVPLQLFIFLRPCKSWQAIFLTNWYALRVPRTTDTVNGTSSNDGGTAIAVLVRASTSRNGWSCISARSAHAGAKQTYDVVSTCMLLLLPDFSPVG